VGDTACLFKQASMGEGERMKLQQRARVSQQGINEQIKGMIIICSAC